VRRRFDAIHARIRTSRLFVATHMHAGDGNVHTNIPVNSNDYAMLQEAERIVERVMGLARSLGGVISGEHGIGITKMQFLEPDAVAAFARYKRRVDPQGHFNRGKLLGGSGLHNAYTPSLRLVEQEALILEASALGDLNAAIKDCLRCGKCKPVCTTHVPRANLLYSPRNKILATGMIIEAFLYAARHLAAAFPRDERCGRSLHRLPQVPEPVSGPHRLRRRVGEDAQHSQGARQEAAQSRHLAVDGLSQRYRSGHYQADA
jgi:ferredoxin